MQKQYVTGGYDGTDYYAILTAAANALPEQTNPDDGQPDDGTTEPQPPQEGGNLGLIIGLSVGGAVVLADNIDSRLELRQFFLHLAAHQAA